MSLETSMIVKSLHCFTRETSDAGGRRAQSRSSVQVAERVLDHWMNDPAAVGIQTGRESLALQRIVRHGASLGIQRNAQARTVCQNPACMSYPPPHPNPGRWPGVQV